ncbi:rhomboid family intramembrane serine protease [Clostridium sp. AL.422]|uniref:rhomboid family intramembrane serine protease n=1 Tax=Clostridium TaxID=1485 RepID=UPI00293DCA81|nr:MULTISPECIES: rhomboid family intramembrane serine protease [unclassified Clostridium]MDV4149756.1 rhomboid family intramembrane serine protease [Clostridium sp. AL.422]
MEKFEKIFFNVLTKEMKFFMKDYYSNYNNEEKWLALLELDSAYIAVLVVNDSEEDVIYNEAREYLSDTLNKPFIINLIVLTSGDYISYGENYYNKLVFSLKERNVIYCSEGSKAFIPVIDYILKVDNNKRKGIKEYKYTYTIILINIIIFLVEIIKSRNFIDIDIYTLAEMGAKINLFINNGQFYRLLTAAFLHGGIVHILFNMSALNIIGRQVENVYGGKRFLIIYLLSALGGNVFSYLFKPESISVGASGAVFGLLGAMLVFGIKERKKIGKGYAKNILETIGLNVIIGITIPNIDNFAHIGGLLIGFVIAFILFNKKSLIS